MIINGKNYLLLVRRGCEFFPGETETHSDIGNYRVFVEFTDKNDVEVCGDFQMGCRWRFHNQRTGAKLKKPVLLANWALAAALQYTDQDGFCWRYNTPDDIHQYDYTEESILTVVNQLSRDHYDAIKYIENIQLEIPADENFVPRDKICEWAQHNHIQLVPLAYGQLAVSLYCGLYCYLCYSIQTINPNKIQLTITLERIGASLSDKKEV